MFVGRYGHKMKAIIRQLCYNTKIPVSASVYHAASRPSETEI
ncbi:hypothetical protein NEISUBOT_04006 [Neisseria subflava NJ9703]|uniref:Uncharacterized protein n=1 Tax=Neisseria subflava NJ9703 TaxID=546268 RepID=A0A9W5IRZ5_NEISU|nr:hypothetical protein NEISUBOT_04006 [Neisseria subflava NJ9703]